MPVEFIRIAHTSDYSETNTFSGPVVQPDYLYRIARVHEQSGFDRVLVAHSSSMPDGFTVAGQILNATERLGVLLAHRPGFIAPTIAARTYATIDAFHPGRIALHVISGGDDADQARDGDFSDKPTRYRRTDEFLDMVEREWSSAERFDYEGEFYRVKGALSSVRPAGGHLPVYFGGASADASGWAAGTPTSTPSGASRSTASGSGSPRSRPPPGGRPHGRPVLGQPPPDRGRRRGGGLGAGRRDPRAHPGARRRLVGLRSTAGSEGSQRLLRYAGQQDLHDKRLWTALSKATGAAGNSTALVGSYEQVAESLLDYVAVGASTLLIRGYDPVGDAAAYADLVRLVHEKVGDDVLGFRAAAPT